MPRATLTEADRTFATACYNRAAEVVKAAGMAKRMLTREERERAEQELCDAEDACGLEHAAGFERPRFARIEDAVRGEIALSAVPGGATSPARATRRAGGKLFAEMFGSAERSEWGSADEFLAVLHSGFADPRLIAGRMNTGVPSEGGFSVPTEYVAEWFDSSLESEIFRPRCTVVPMLEQTRQWPGWDLSDASTGAPFGFKPQWLGEGAEADLQIGKMRMLLLRAQKLGLLIEATNEVLTDGAGFEGQLGAGMTAAIGWSLDAACISGTGVGQPLGLINDPAKITIAKESGQANATILYANVAKMLAALHPACFKNSIWIANPTTIPQLLQLAFTIKNVAGNENVGGSHVPVITESNGEFRLLTRPVIFTEKCPALGSVGDLIFCDPTQYVIGLRKDMTIDKSAHVGFTRDCSTFRGIIRVDGMSKWNKAYTPLNGTALSWAVVLAAR